MTDETRQKLDEVIQEAEVDPAALTDWHLAVLRAARDRIAELEQGYANACQREENLRDDSQAAGAKCEQLREALTYEVKRLATSLRRLSYAAQTTGGTADPDRDLQGAIKQAEWALGCSDTTLAAFAADQQADPSVCAENAHTGEAADQQGEREDKTAHGPSYDAGWNAALEEAAKIADSHGCRFWVGRKCKERCGFIALDILRLRQNTP